MAHRLNIFFLFWNLQRHCHPKGHLIYTPNPTLRFDTISSFVIKIIDTNIYKIPQHTFCAYPRSHPYSHVTVTSPHHSLVGQNISGFARLPFPHRRGPLSIAGCFGEGDADPGGWGLRNQTLPAANGNKQKHNFWGLAVSKLRGVDEWMVTYAKTPTYRSPDKMHFFSFPPPPSPAHSLFSPQKEASSSSSVPILETTMGNLLLEVQSNSLKWCTSQAIHHA